MFGLSTVRVVSALYASLALRMLEHKRASPESALFGEESYVQRSGSEPEGQKLEIRGDFSALAMTVSNKQVYCKSILKICQICLMEPIQGVDAFWTVPRPMPK